MNMVNVSIESSAATLSSWSVLEAVQEVAPPAVLGLFDMKTRDAATADHYADDGNTRKLLLLNWEKMLLPLARRAHAERNSILLRVYTQLWEFFRACASVCKAVLTLKADGYATQLERLEADVEIWVQILIVQTPLLYNARAYVELLRYVVPAQAR
jgi:hypothetical protein